MDPKKVEEAYQKLIDGMSLEDMLYEFLKSEWEWTEKYRGAFIPIEVPMDRRTRGISPDRPVVGVVKPAPGVGPKEKKFLEDFKAHYGYERKWRELETWLHEMDHDDGPNAKAELSPREVLDKMLEIEGK